MSFWGSNMTELLGRARQMPGFHEGMTPMQFHEWLNAELKADVSPHINPEDAAEQWLSVLKERVEE